MKNKTEIYNKLANLGGFCPLKKGKAHDYSLARLLFGSNTKWKCEISPVTLTNMVSRLAVKVGKLARQTLFREAVRSGTIKLSLLFLTLSFSSETLVFLFSLSKQNAT